MKEVIFLIDTGNAKFIVENDNGKYRLPTVEKINENDDICNKFFEKYEIKLEKEKIEILNENAKYILIRTYMNNFEVNDKYNSYKICDINKIIDLKEKVQKEVLLDINMNIEKEIINDSFWLGIILSVEDKIKDVQMKNILTSFLLFFCSIFCEECVKYKLGEVKAQKINVNLKKMRNFYLKHCPIYNSKNMKQVINEMGIDFSNPVFDIVLLFVDENLIDTNVRNWEMNKKTNDYKDFNSIILSPRRWIKNQFPQYNDWFEDIRKLYVDEFIERFSKVKIVQKSYSANKVFNVDLSNDEKVYILNRIGLLKIVKLFSEIFRTGNFVGKKFNNDLYLDFDMFLIKVKATLIEIIWNDNKNNNIPFLSKMLNNLPQELDKDFFNINRKCRDNIHYGFFNKIKEEEYGLLEKNQDIYLNYIIKEFDNTITYKFGMKYDIAIKIADFLYKINNKKK